MRFSSDRGFIPLEIACLRPFRRPKSRARFLKGFTLIELLLALAIISMLATFAYSYFGQTRMKARDARRQMDFKKINLAMEMCYADGDCAGVYRYPATAAGPNSVAQIDTDGNPIYITMPEDPKNTAPYQYTWTDNTSPFQHYCVYVKMELEDNTYLCASNKGVFKKTESGYAPSNSDCCGVNVAN